VTQGDGLEGDWAAEGSLRSICRGCATQTSYSQLFRA